MIGGPRWHSQSKVFFIGIPRESYWHEKCIATEHAIIINAELNAVYFACSLRQVIFFFFTFFYGKILDFFPSLFFSNISIALFDF